MISHQVLCSLRISNLSIVTTALMTNFIMTFIKTFILKYRHSLQFLILIHVCVDLIRIPDRFLECWEPWSPVLLGIISWIWGFQSNVCLFNLLDLNSYFVICLNVNIRHWDDFVGLVEIAWSLFFIFFWNGVLCCAGASALIHVSFTVLIDWLR